MLNLIQKSVAVLVLIGGLSALTVNFASATAPCPGGICNLVVAPQSCPRVEVVGAPVVNLRASNRFSNRSNVIGVSYRRDVFKLKRCTDKGCRIMLQTEQGPMAAWIHSNYVRCTRKPKVQQCGLYRLSGDRHSDQHVHSHKRQSTTWTNPAGTFSLSITGPASGHSHGYARGHSSLYATPARPAYGQLYLNFSLGGSSR